VKKPITELTFIIATTFKDKNKHWIRNKFKYYFPKNGNDTNLQNTKTIELEHETDHCVKNKLSSVMLGIEFRNLEIRGSELKIPDQWRIPISRW